MRAATFIAPVGPSQPVSADPRDVLDHGEVPRHRLAGSVFHQDGQRLKLRGELGDPVLVRLPRRLTQIRTEDARRWIRGEEPEPNALCPGLMAIGSAADPWERRYPRRGLGLPKPLPRRRTPEAAPSTTTTGPFFHIREQLTIATNAMEKAGLELVKRHGLSETAQMIISMDLASIGNRSLYENGVRDVVLDVRTVHDPQGRGAIDPARPHLGLQVWPRWCGP